MRIHVFEAVFLVLAGFRAVSEIAAQTPREPSRYKSAWDQRKRRHVCKDAFGAVGLNGLSPEALISTKRGECADLTGGVELTNADLTGADLRLARLVGGHLAGAFLNGARLEGADLRGAGLSLDRLHLEGAIFDQWTRLPSVIDLGMADRFGMIYLSAPPPQWGLASAVGETAAKTASR